MRRNNLSNSPSLRPKPKWNQISPRRSDSKPKNNNQTLENSPKHAYSAEEGRPSIVKYGNYFSDLLKSIGAIRSIPQNSLQEIIKSVRLTKSTGETIIKGNTYKTNQSKCNTFWTNWKSIDSSIIREFNSQLTRIRNVCFKYFRSLRTVINDSHNNILSDQSANNQQITSILDKLLDTVDELESTAETIFDIKINNPQYSEEEVDKFVSKVKQTQKDIGTTYKPALVGNTSLGTKPISTQATADLRGIIQALNDMKELQNCSKQINNKLSDIYEELRKMISGADSVPPPQEIIKSPQVSVKVDIPVSKQTKQSAAKASQSSNDDDSIQSLKSRLNISKNSIIQLNNEIASSQQSLGQEKNSLQRAKQNFGKRQKEFINAKTDLQETNEKIKSLQQEKAELLKKIDSLKESLEEKPKSVEKTQELEEVIADSENLKSQLIVAYDQMLTTTDTYKELECEYETLIKQLKSDNLPLYETNKELRQKLSKILSQNLDERFELLNLSAIRDRVQSGVLSNQPTKIETSKKRLKQLRSELDEKIAEYTTKRNCEDALVIERFTLKSLTMPRDEELLQKLGRVRTEFDNICDTTVPRRSESEMNELETLIMRFDSRLYRTRNSMMKDPPNEAAEEVKLLNEEIEHLKKRYLAACNWNVELSNNDMKEQARALSLKVQLAALNKKLQNPSFNDKEYISSFIEALTKEVQQVSELCEDVNTSVAELSQYVGSTP
ncbi:hypothetical protein TVAG_325590 [Trichomonas vaginalis G3]|uniref:Uncharacterized protein n=1 Tax=Trichomonas vaginalis (strain ATCC PRA-98 / G3) TaxID=412133 RepID=A2EWG0_TRIV3|nr:hypothetical protein TVAGG3_0876960 [Trichomonas vaginalis G3]EAY02987.1 hypothetical protein TVAG_325590 [Trichomonas vaginalis G3]KAI5501759.1 hypothetical protein TVAGG3_0876960 [Trichomonas vaginalis G3]|eukprot:XP_001315210.1 hypothetical protein [Trichomonas vaginalis G3]